MKIANLKGMSAKDINKTLNAYRRKMNSIEAIKCVKIITDPDEAKDLELDKVQNRKEKEPPEEFIEISEEQVEEIISTHDDLK